MTTPRSQPCPTDPPDPLAFLYSLRPFAPKLGLDTPRKLAALAGNPHHHLKFIHVAGTNGKGSTCAMLEGIYRQSGLRVGLFTSPHLTTFGERIQVNRQFIPPEITNRLITELKPLLDQFPTASRPSFFEIVTILALRHFLNEQCDLVIWEAGLGGRLDATNIVTPEAAVITNIALDHQKWLGNSIAAIATEKAGIIKPNLPVITAADHPDALAVLSQTAESLGAPLHLVTNADIEIPPLNGLKLPLAGQHQQLNAATALATTRVLAATYPVSPDQIRHALESLDWPGRTEKFSHNNQTYLLDGAHNPAAAHALTKSIQSQFPDQHPSLILGLFRDKQTELICQHLAPVASHIYTVPIESDRTAHPEDLAQFCRRANPNATITSCPDLQTALHACNHHPLTIITGSLYLVGQARDLLGLSTKKNNDRPLNDWTQKPPSHK